MWSCAYIRPSIDIDICEIQVRHLGLQFFENVKLKVHDSRVICSLDLLGPKHLVLKEPTLLIILSH